MARERAGALLLLEERARVLGLDEALITNDVPAGSRAADDHHAAEPDTGTAPR